MNTQLNEAELDPNLIDNAKFNLATGNGIGFVICAKPGGMLGLVFDNTGILKSKGMYEDALVVAFTGVRASYWRWHVSNINQMFLRADRNMLLKAGDPFLAPIPLRVYRGVSGTQQKRHIKGVSWTTDLDQACWFAMRCNLEDPAVFTALVRPDEIYCYTNGRTEAEVLCMPRSCRRLDLSVDDLRKGTDRVVRRHQTAPVIRMPDEEPAPRLPSYLPITSPASSRSGTGGNPIRFFQSNSSRGMRDHAYVHQVIMARSIMVENGQGLSLAAHRRP